MEKSWLRYGVPVTLARTRSKVGLVKKAKPYFQNNQGKKGWRCSSSGRVNCLAQRPEVKPSIQPKAKQNEHHQQPSRLALQIVQGLVLVCSFVFLVVLEVEFSTLLGRCSTT
jgi:hypothetical protein